VSEGKRLSAFSIVSDLQLSLFFNSSLADASGYQARASVVGRQAQVARPATQVALQSRDGSSPDSAAARVLSRF
jgi:hypothetical protein